MLAIILALKISNIYIKERVRKREREREREKIYIKENTTH